MQRLSAVLLLLGLAGWLNRVSCQPILLSMAAQPTTDPCKLASNGSAIAPALLVSTVIMVQSCDLLATCSSSWCTSMLLQSANMTVNSTHIIMHSWQSPGCQATDVAVTCNGTAGPSSTWRCAGALVTNEQQLSAQLLQLQQGSDNVTLNVPAGSRVQAKPAYHSYNITHNVLIQSTELGTLAWLDLQAGSDSWLIQPGTGLLQLSSIGLMNLALGPPTQFIMSSFVGVLWGLEFPRITGVTSLQMINVALAVPSDLYQYLKVWFTRLLSPIGSVRASALWIANLPNATLTDFQLAVGTGADVIYNTYRRPPGQEWINVTIAAASTLNVTLMPSVSTSGLLGLGLDPTEYVAAPQVTTACKPSDLVHALGASSSEKPYVVAACNISFANYNATPTVATAAATAVGGGTAGASTPNATVVPLPAKLPPTTILLQQHPLLLVSLDLGNEACVADTQAGSSLHLRNLVLYNGGVQQLSPGATAAATQNFTAGLWTICNITSETSLFLENVTIVVPPEEFVVWSSAAKAESCGCAVTSQETTLLDNWRRSSAIVSVTQHAVGVDTWRGWRWSGYRITITSDNSVGPFTSQPLSPGVMFGQPAPTGRKSVPVVAWAVPVAVGVPLLVLLVAGLLWRLLRHRQRRAAAAGEQHTGKEGSAHAKSIGATGMAPPYGGPHSAHVTSMAGHMPTSNPADLKLDMPDGVNRIGVDAMGSSPIPAVGLGAAAGALEDGQACIDMHVGGSGVTTPTTGNTPRGHSFAPTARPAAQPVSSIRLEVETRPPSLTQPRPFSTSEGGGPSPQPRFGSLNVQHTREGVVGLPAGQPGGMQWSARGIAVSPQNSMVYASGSASRSSYGSMSSASDFSDSRMMLSDSFDKPGSEYGDYNLIASQDVDSILKGIRTELQDTHKLVIYGVLGAGAHGVVYKGEWRGRPVAVKTLLFQEHVLGGRGKQQAMQEVAVNSRFAAHPNIVNTYTFELKPITQLPVDGQQGEGLTINELHGCVGDYKLYIVQEFCDAGHLKKLIDSGRLHDGQGQPDMLSVVQVALDLACGLQHVHFKNVIHGDLSPANVLLKSDTNRPGHLKAIAKVGDFGLSRTIHREQSHVSNVRAGTPFYTAPEVLLHGQLTRAADVFSLGVILYELYCGQPPWRRRPPTAASSKANRRSRKAGAGASPLAQVQLGNPLLSDQSRQSTPMSGEAGSSLRAGDTSLLQSGPEEWQGMDGRTRPLSHQETSGVGRSLPAADPNDVTPDSQCAIGPDVPIEPMGVVELTGQGWEALAQGAAAGAFEASLDENPQQQRTSTDSQEGGEPGTSGFGNTQTELSSAASNLSAPPTMPPDRLLSVITSCSESSEPQDTAAQLAALHRYMIAPDGSYPLQLPHSCPAWYKQLVRSCLQGDPMQRPKLPQVVTLLMQQQASLLEEAQQQESQEGAAGAAAATLPPK